VIRFVAMCWFVFYVSLCRPIVLHNCHYWQNIYSVAFYKAYIAMDLIYRGIVDDYSATDIAESVGVGIITKIG